MTPNTDPAPQFVSPDKFRYLLFGVGGFVFAVLALLGLGEDLQLPPKPPRPSTSVASAEAYSQRLGRNQGAYAAFLSKDAREYGASDPTLEGMSGVFRYRLDKTEHTLSVGKGDRNSVETAGLRLTLSVRERRRKKPTLVLQIENLLDQPVAYRVETRPSRGTGVCGGKEEMLHNAMALAVGDIEIRSECVFQRGTKISVWQVETIELPSLSYHYVSRVFPTSIGLDRRTTRSHKSPVGTPCHLALPAGVQRNLETGATSWRDVVDFYARHRCETYIFPSGYRAFTRANERPLPAVEPAP